MRYLAIVLILGAMLAAPSTTWAGGNFNGYPTCAILDPSPPADSSCFEGDAFGAVFVAKHKDDVKYKLCATYKGDKDCHTKRTDKAGEPSRIGLFRSGDIQGDWQLKWRVPGAASLSVLCST
jgi:hypothetical protein